MSAVLLDVNVLVGLAWPNHFHHGETVKWFRRLAGDQWATCAVTELGFIGVSSNPRIVGEEVSAHDAASLLRELKRHGTHAYWSNTVEVSELESSLLRAIVGPRQVTDAVLLATARANNGRLATLDQGVAELARAAFGSDEDVERIVYGD